MAAYFTADLCAGRMHQRAGRPISRIFKPEEAPVEIEIPSRHLVVRNAGSCATVD
jgi:hypothetical protein